MLERRDFLKTLLGVVTLSLHRPDFERIITNEKKEIHASTDNTCTNIRRIRINPKYTFDTFVPGGSNRFAFSAAMTVANGGKKYNPLFISGGSGLGKTHLMHAIANKALEEIADIKMLYVTSEQFADDLVSAIRHGKTPEFKGHYRSASLLLIDDLHFIKNRPATQAELFHTFDALYESQKQIVMTSRMPPHQIKNITNALRSRLGRGIVAHIQPCNSEPGFVQYITRKKAEATGIVIPDDIYSLIASKSHNVREIEGLLSQLDYRSRILGEPISLDAIGMI